MLRLLLSVLAKVDVDARPSLIAVDVVTAAAVSVGDIVFVVVVVDVGVVVVVDVSVVIVVEC